MPNARLEKELSFMAPDRIGLLNEVSRVLADAGINIISLSAYEMDGNANFMMVTSNSAKAKKILKSKGYEVDENEVVLYELENEVGAMSNMSDRLAAEGINIRYLYGTTGAEDMPALLVFACSDNRKAASILNS